MKVCPICQSTYEVTVDFCFKDGAPLEAEASSVTGEESVAPDFTALTMEELEPPDAVSLSGLIPIATPEDELRTLSMEADVPPQLEEDELATVTSGVQSIAKADEAADEDSDISDPFEQPEAAEFRDRVTKSHPVWQLGPDGEAGGTDKTEDAMETVQWTGLPSGIPSQGGSGQGFLKGLALAVALVAGLAFAYPMISGDPETKVAAVDPAVSATEEAPDRQDPDPEVSGPDSSGEEAVADQGASEAEGSPADEMPPADEDGAAVDEDGAAAEEGEAGPPDSSDEEEGSPPEADPPATEDEKAADSDRGARDDELADARERRRLEQKKERKQRLKDERERARAAAAREKLAARDTAKEGSTMKAVEPKAVEDSAPTAWNPWTSGGSAAPQPVAASGDKGVDPANPWGVGAPAAEPAPAARTRVSISTKPAGAKVKVAGTSRGASPVKMELPLGTHEIQVSKEGYLPGSRYVKVTDADPISVSIALEPIASAAAKRDGTLFISSSPSGALLYVDGSSKGRTPISVTVTEGAHSLKLVSDGREPVEKRIRVDFARSTTVRRFIEIP